MKVLLTITLALTLGLSTGCMVIEEIDKAQALMPETKNKKGNKTTPTESADAVSPAVAKRNALLEQSKEWWGKATSLSPKAVSPGIARCQISGGTQYMSKDDCLARGGRPQGVSG